MGENSCLSAIRQKETGELMMGKQILLLFLLFMLCLGCDSARKKHTGGEFNGTPETKPAFEESSNIPEKKSASEELSGTFETKPAFEESNNTLEKKYTFEEFKTEFIDVNYWDMPIGTWFWDEFGELEAQYGLNKDESKLLGKWMNVTFPKSLYYNYYIFYPNKLFFILFKSRNFRVIAEEEAYFKKAVGTWEIVGDTVRITIYAVVTEDRTKESPNNESVFFVERSYTFDFINIEDIDERGFTARPVNGNVLSAELERKVRIAEPNRTNNLYVRNVYFISFLNGGVKGYDYFDIVPEMARENISGYEVATDTRLIKRFIFGLWL
jgi:hypothetical protein